MSSIDESGRTERSASVAWTGDDAKISLDDQLDLASDGFGTFQQIVLLSCILLYVAEGMGLLVTNITWNVMPLQEWGLTADQDYLRGVLVSASYFGFVIGSLFAGLAGDSWGRRPLMLLHCAIYIPFSILSALANSFEMLMVARFFVGVSVGMVNSALSMMAEVAPRATRGRSILVIPGTAFALGQVIVLLLGIYLISTFGYNCQGCHWWRWMLMIGVLPEIVAVILILLYVPESPRYLLVQGKGDELAEVMRHIAKINDREEYIVDNGHCQPLQKDEEFTSFLSNTLDLFDQPLVRLVPLAVVTWCFLSVAIYGQAFMWPIYVEQTGLSHIQQFELMALVAFMEIPAMLILVVLIDWPASDGSDELWVGRRLFLLYCTLLSGAWVLLHIFMRTWGVVWMIIGNIGFRLFSVYPYKVNYVYVAELLPTSHRNCGIALGNAATKMVAGILPLVLQPLMSINMESPFILVLACTGIAILLIWVSPDVDRNLADTTNQLDMPTFGTPRNRTPRPRSAYRGSPVSQRTGSRVLPVFKATPPTLSPSSTRQSEHDRLLHKEA